jgi:hypothetical protein
MILYGYASSAIGRHYRRPRLKVINQRVRAPSALPRSTVTFVLDLLDLSCTGRRADLRWNNYGTRATRS